MIYNISIIPKRTIHLSKCYPKFYISNCSLSPKVIKLSESRRQHFTIDSNIDEINNKKSIVFDFLESICKLIKFKYIRIAGFYKLTNKQDSSRFYIESSNNLARRIKEYNKLTKSLRAPCSSANIKNFGFIMRFIFYISYYSIIIFNLLAICNNQFIIFY